MTAIEIELSNQFLPMWFQTSILRMWKYRQKISLFCYCPHPDLLLHYRQWSKKCNSNLLGVCNLVRGRQGFCKDSWWYHSRIKYCVWQHSPIKRTEIHLTLSPFPLIFLKFPSSQYTQTHTHTHTSKHRHTSQISIMVDWFSKKNCYL